VLLGTLFGVKVPEVLLCTAISAVLAVVGAKLLMT
jgi:hypothetical protein